MKKTIYKQPQSAQIDDIVFQIAEEIQGSDPENLVGVLTDLHQRYGKLTDNILIGVAKGLNLSMHQVNSVASFYSMLATENPKKTIRLCDGPVCWCNGAADILKEAEKLENEDWILERSSCLGLCDCAPSGLVGEAQIGHLASIEDIRKFIDKPDDSFENKLSAQKPGEIRVLLADIDKIDPENIVTAIDCGVFEGLSKALSLSPEDVIGIVKESGLVGRGGAGFPTGMKWSFVAGEKDSERYIVCNGDESEPLAVKDRVLINANPFLLVAGMTIAGYAVGAAKGFIYIRGEYAAQAKLLENAIHQAEAQGLLGNNILESGFNFTIHVHRGAGAYICGEETALLESLEGQRGEPRLRPPYPTTAGYMGKPTVVNNVETLSNVPIILREGTEWYRNLSDSAFTGTKIYTILGHVNTPCVFEAPFGLTLSEMIENFGGGMLDGREFKFALVGGAAGKFVPAELLDLPLDYRSGDKGAHLGVGAALVCDASISPVALLRELLHFFETESCGKCTPCRVGTHQTRVLLDKMLAGEGPADAIEQLMRLSKIMGSASFCGLGMSVPWPIDSAIKHFRPTFENVGNENSKG